MSITLYSDPQLGGAVQSGKYNFSDCNWITNITYLMSKVKIKQKLSYPVSQCDDHVKILLFYKIYVACVMIILVEHLLKHNWIN